MMDGMRPTCQHSPSGLSRIKIYLAVGPETSIA
jgi:hypothetical protein